MACFLAAAAEAAVVTAVVQGMKRQERKQAAAQHQTLEQHTAKLASDGTIPWSRRLSWLANLLWGGSLLLCFEHVWHGEIVPWFPFFTAAADPAAMLHEIATVGVTMALIVTAAWAVMAAVVPVLGKRPAQTVSRMVQ